MPRLQVVKGRNAVADAAVAGTEKGKAKSKVEGVGTNLERKGSVFGVEAEKRALRKEIKDWWQGVAEHLDRLVSVVSFRSLCQAITTVGWCSG